MKILIFEDGGFTTKVLTHIFTKINENHHEVTAFRGVQCLENWVCFDQDLQPVTIQPSDFDLVIIDQNLHGEIKFTQIVAELSPMVPCFGLSSLPETNLLFKNAGAKLALTKVGAFAGLHTGRIDLSQVSHLSVEDETDLADFEVAVAHPTDDATKHIRQETETFMNAMIVKYLV